MSRIAHICFKGKTDRALCGVVPSGDHLDHVFGDARDGHCECGAPVCKRCLRTKAVAPDPFVINVRYVVEGEM